LAGIQSFGVGNAAKARIFKIDISNRVFYHNCTAIGFKIVSFIKFITFFYPVRLVF